MNEKEMGEEYQAEGAAGTEEEDLDMVGRT